MNDIEQAISNFDDEVSSITSKQCEITYKNFATSYWDAFATIWNKANNVGMKTILKSVADKELNELQCMAHLLKPEQPLPTVIKETHKVPALDNILGAMASHLPLQNIPSKEVCELISTVFSNLSEAHKFQAKATRGIADLATLVTPKQMTFDPHCSCPTDAPVSIATWNNITTNNTITTTCDSDNRGWPTRHYQILQSTHFT